MQIKLVGTRTCLSLPKGTQYLNIYKQYNESLRINANEELQKFKDFVIEKFDVLRASCLAEVDSFKNRHLNFSGNDVLVENPEQFL